MLLVKSPSDHSALPLGSYTCQRYCSARPISRLGHKPHGTTTLLEVGFGRGGYSVPFKAGSSLLSQSSQLGISAYSASPKNEWGSVLNAEESILRRGTAPDS